MKLATIFSINAGLALVFGLGFVLMPETLLSSYGIELSEPGLFVGQLLGAAFLGFAIITWLVRNSGESDVLRAIVLAFFIENTIGFVVALKGQLAGLANTLGWSTVAIYALLAVGYGYFQFQKDN